MNRPFLLPPLAAEKLLELQRLLRAHSTPPGLYRWCNLIWQLAAGFNLGEASEIARLHYTYAHRWAKRFQRSGISGLSNRPRPGRPRLYGKNPETLVMIQTATSLPPDLGLGFTTWSLAKLEEHLRKRHSTLKSLSRETIRRILTRHGLRFLTGQTWCKSEDLDFEVKKRHHRSLSSSSTEGSGRQFRRIGTCSNPSPKWPAMGKACCSTAGQISSQWNSAVVWGFLPNYRRIGGTRKPS